MFVLHGTGRKGKGVFLKTIGGMLGEHAGTADFSVFTARKHDSGPRDDVANMAGKRLIMAQESREGGFDESLVKWLTGGD